MGGIVLLMLLNEWTAQHGAFKRLDPNNSPYVTLVLVYRHTRGAKGWYWYTMETGTLNKLSSEFGPFTSAVSAACDCMTATRNTDTSDAS